jgi:predicted double-glycine peptidase
MYSINILSLRQLSRSLPLAVCVWLLLGPSALAGPVLPGNTIKVPQTRQATDYTCGVAALQAVLGYYGEDNRESELARILQSDNVKGTAYQNIADLARKRGYKVTINKTMTIAQLEESINRRVPVICLIQAWPDKKVDYAKDWDDGHYVVAIGYDATNLYFMDPSTLGNYTYIPKKEFLQRWHDIDGKERLVHFGMSLSKPSTPYRSGDVKAID